jgi:hypothetical protein
MLGLGEILRGARRRAWAETQIQSDQPDTVLMTDWVPEAEDSELILQADITGA